MCVSVRWCSAPEERIADLNGAKTGYVFVLLLFSVCSAKISNLANKRTEGFPLLQMCSTQICSIMRRMREASNPQIFPDTDPRSWHCFSYDSVIVSVLQRTQNE